MGEDRQKPPNVLLVEDDPDRARLTEHAVETSSSRCELTIAATGRDALDLVADHAPEGIDLVLLDLDLPDVYGHEVCTEIRTEADRSQVPIIVLTSSNEKEDVEASYAAGANGHVAKSVSFQEFREDLAAILAYWLDVNETVSAVKA